MYRSFILGLILSFGIMGAVGFWLRSNGNPPPTAEVPQPQPHEAVRAGEAEQPDAPPPHALLTRVGLPAMDAQVAVPRKGDFTVPAAPAALPEGALPRKAVQAAVPGVIQCFRATKKRFPPPQQAVLKFTARREGDTGQLQDAQVVEASNSDPWLRSCLTGALSDARFAMAEGEGAETVTWPFRFEQR
jgi:hypothetical protein